MRKLLRNIRPDETAAGGGARQFHLEVRGPQSGRRHGRAGARAQSNRIVGGSAFRRRSEAVKTRGAAVVYPSWPAALQRQQNTGEIRACGNQ